MASEMVNIREQPAIESILQCPICLDEFNDSGRTPKIMACGHNFCLKCICSIKIKKEGDLRYLPCAICRKLQRLPLGGVSDLPDDFRVAQFREAIDVLDQTLTKSIKAEPKEAAVTKSMVSPGETDSTDHDCPTDLDTASQRSRDGNGGERDRFCVICNDYVTAVNFETTCKNHQILNVSDYVDDMKKQIKEALGDVDDKFQSAEFYALEVDVTSERYEAIFAKVKTDLGDQLTKMFSAVWDQHEELLEDLKKRKETLRLELIRRRMRATEDLFFYSEVKRLLQCGTDGLRALQLTLATVRRRVLQPDVETDIPLPIFRPGPGVKPTDFGSIVENKTGSDSGPGSPDIPHTLEIETGSDSGLASPESLHTPISSQPHSPSGTMTGSERAGGTLANLPCWSPVQLPGMFGTVEVPPLDKLIEASNRCLRDMGLPHLSGTATMSSSMRNVFPALFPAPSTSDPSRPTTMSSFSDCTGLPHLAATTLVNSVMHDMLPDMFPATFPATFPVPSTSYNRRPNTRSSGRDGGSGSGHQIPAKRFKPTI